MNNNEFQALLDRADKTIEKSIQYLVSNGEEYDLAEWVTIKEYCNRFSIESTNVVSNWIKRGVIPADNVITIERLNDLRLIKAVSYK